jgi:hypothetical protein
MPGSAGKPGIIGKNPRSDGGKKSFPRALILKRPEDDYAGMLSKNWNDSLCPSGEMKDRLEWVHSGNSGI